MAIVAYIDRTTGEYPISLQAVRDRAENIGFGSEPTDDVLDAANVDPVLITTPIYDGATEVPTEIAPENVEGQWFQRWTVEPKPKYIPQTVTAAQAQVALYNAGILEQVEQIIQAHPYPKVRIWWRAARDWERQNAYVIATGYEMDLSDEDMDNLFLAASVITL